jgi:hypothetical protein
VLLLRLSCENAQNGEIVLDLLKSCKGRLAVIRYVPSSLVARRRRASKSVPERLGPTAQKRLGQFSQLVAEVPSNPARALRFNMG